MLLTEGSSPVEHELIAQWLTGSEYTGASSVQLATDDVFAHVSGRADDPLVVPVRVVWLPAERDGVRRARWRDLLTLHNPRNPDRMRQRWIVRNAPDRHRVLVGQPAKLSELRTRHQEAQGDSTRYGLAKYIVRSAVVALERAERALIGDRYKVPRMVVEEILDDPQFRDGLADIAGRVGMPTDEAVRRATDNLHELVAAQSRLVTDLFTETMAPLHRRAWTVHADESGLAELRAHNRSLPLVFLPSHRSYVDPFVLGDVLAQHDFPPNHLIGGANLSFWPLGPIARRSGAVFIRRSFGDDEIYKFVVEEYFAYLLAKRFNLEWYFEGGRTRTGKLRPPRYGLLNYLADAVRDGRVDDAMLVPVSITYERLNELGAIASEQLGAAKQPEGLAWLARYVRSQQQSAGHVYVRFGAPMSAREHLGAHGDPAIQGAAEDDAAERRAVQRLAFDIAVRINEVTPITASALVTFALLGADGRALTIPEIRAAIDPILRYIEQRGIPQGELSVVRTIAGLAGVLEKLRFARVVTAYTGGAESVYSIVAGQHLVAAFYRNSAIHWFVNRALVEVTMVAGDGTDWTHAHQLRDLLKFEFFFPDRDAFEAELRAERALLRDDGLAGAEFLIAPRVLRPFLDAQLVVAERLAVHPPATPVDRKHFVTECVAVGKQLLLQGRLHSPESVSSELFTAAIKLADNRNLITPGDDELRARRVAFATELRTISALVDKVAMVRIGLETEG